MGQVVLVRHGQAQENRSGSEELTPLGWEQSRLLGAALRARGVEPAVVATGTARCHLEALERLGEAACWVDVPGVLDSGWDEFDHAVLVRQLPTRLSEAEASPAQLQQWFDQAAARWTSGAEAPGESGAEAPGESFRDFRSRVHTALAELLEMLGPREAAVVVTSAGPIAAVAATLLSADDSGEVWRRLNGVVVHGSSTTISLGPRGAALVSFNEHAHLQSTR